MCGCVVIFCYRLPVLQAKLAEETPERTAARAEARVVAVGAGLEVIADVCATVSDANVASFSGVAVAVLVIITDVGAVTPQTSWVWYADVRPRLRGVERISRRVPVPRTIVHARKVVGVGANLISRPASRLLLRGRFVTITKRAAG